MGPLPMLLLVLGALAPDAARAQGEAATWLERLAAPEAELRERAQRWLAAELAPEDYADLARAARGGDAELRRRLGDALAAADEHLALVVPLLSEEDERLADLGRRAFRELVARWCPEAPGRALPPGRLAGRLPGDDGLVAMGPERARPARLLDRLARLWPLDVPLVLAPELDGEEEVAFEGAQGSATEVLEALTSAARLSWSAVGADEDGEAAPGAWVLVAPRGGARRVGGVEVLRDWCVAVHAGGAPAAPAARALASTEWPAAAAWLERRWSARGDEAAFEGLLVAAERGRTAPLMADAKARRRLLELADAAARRGPEGTARLERVARALARIGPLDALGRRHDGLLLEGWAEKGDRYAWACLVGLEGQRTGGERAAAALRALVADPREMPPELRLQALRSLARQARPGDAPLAPARAGELVEHVLVAGAREEWIELAAALRLALADRDVLGAVDAPRPTRRLLLVELRLHAGDEAAAAAALGPLLAAAPLDARALRELAESLARALRRDGAPAVRGLLARVAEAGGAAAVREDVERLRLLSGAATASEEVAGFEALVAGRGDDERALDLAGALAAGPRGTSARRLLRDAVVALAPGGAEDAADGERGPGFVLPAPGDAAPPSAAAVSRALDGAVARLRAARKDAWLQVFVGEVRAAARRAGHPLRERMARDAWPPPARPPALDLARRDRRLAW